MTVNLELTVICHKSYRSDNPSLGRLRPALPSRPPTPQTHLIRKIISKVISSDPVRRLVLGARLAADAVRIPLKQGRPQWTARRRIPNAIGVSRRELSDLPYARRKLPLKARDPRTKILYSNGRFTVFVLTDTGFRFLVFLMNAQSDKERFFGVPSDRFTEVLPLCSRTWSGVRLLRACRRPVRFRLGGILFVSICYGSFIIKLSFI